MNKLTNEQLNEFREESEALEVCFFVMFLCLFVVWSVLLGCCVRQVRRKKWKFKTKRKQEKIIKLSRTFANSTLAIAQGIHILNFL